MPYYVYKILPTVSSIVKNMEQVAEFEIFKEAKTFAYDKRTELAEGDEAVYKIIHAKNSLQAEELLSEKREQPILREWEK